MPSNIEDVPEWARQLVWGAVAVGFVGVIGLGLIWLGKVVL